MASSEEAPLVVLGFGSNRGDGGAIFRAAAERLGARLGSPRLSPFYTSDPMYVVDQPRFLNAALSGRFGGTPRELLALVQETEAAFGRDRSRERPKGERTLDIDILLFGSAVVDEGPVLIIPHPGLAERKFALLPLLALQPDAVHPRTGVPLADSFAALPPQGIYYAELGPYNGPHG
jgi:2-amino-4-hydroxy-6-hydroxymethyldihydropteridine diphosphokinase